MTSFFAYLSDDPRYAEQREPRPTALRRGWLVTLLGKAVIAVVKLRFRVVLAGRLPPVPCVVFSRHDNYWDGVIMAVLDSRICPITSRFWKKAPLVGRFLTGYRVIWTKDGAVDSAVAAVRAGGCPWIALYGFERRTTQREPRSGAAHIARAANCPLVPVSLTMGRGRRPTLAITVGQPIHVLPGETTEALTNRISGTGAG